MKLSRSCFIVSFLLFLSSTAQQDMKSNCFNWPEKPFTPSNYAQVTTSIHVGQKFIDFTLNNIEGKHYKLSDLLKEKNVVLQFGSYTCPIFQSNINETVTLAAKYSDKAFFILVYVVEAHPLHDPSPYTGKVWEMEFSTLRQAMNYTERMDHVRTLLSEVPDIDKNQIILLDDLYGHGKNNPFWCTYGTAANGGYVISRNGDINYSNAWIDLSEVKSWLEKLTT